MTDHRTTTCLIELDNSVSVDQVQRALFAHGMILMTNKKTQRQRVVQVPAYLKPETVDHATQQAERGVEHFPRRDKQIVEPLHHHAHARSNLSNFNQRRKA